MGSGVEFWSVLWPAAWLIGILTGCLLGLVGTLVGASLVGFGVGRSWVVWQVFGFFVGRPLG